MRDAAAALEIVGTIVAGGREALVGELDDGMDPAGLLLDGLFDRDAPGLAVRAMAGGEDLAADLDEEVAAAELEEARRDVVGGVAGRDRREIDLDPGIEFVEEAAARRVAATDVDDLRAGAREMVVDLFGRGRIPDLGAVSEAPARDERGRS